MRTLRAVHAAYRDDIGDLQTRRPLPGPRVEQLDPFLFLNHHGPQVYPPDNHGLPFGPHPHRGFCTMTFIVEGDLLHRDSGGHDSAIKAGGVQWMTAGRGLVHAELSSREFLNHGGPLEILQLWVNLPARLKMTTPRYLGLQGREIPTVEVDGAKVHVSSGEVFGTKGPVSPPIDVALMTVELAPGGRVTLPAPKGRSVLLYTVRGDVRIGERAVPRWSLAELNDEGDQVEMVGGDAPALVLYGHAEPLNEPVVAHGPFVMNSREEIVQAVRDYQAGKFGEEPSARP